MKRILFSFAVLLITAMTASAQTIVKGDMNGDDQVTIADVTSVVNIAIGKAPMETVSVTSEPFAFDNSSVVGTWYKNDGTYFTLNADGTTDFPSGATYEFYPSQGRLLILDAIDMPVKVLSIVKITPTYMLVVNHATETFTFYSKNSVFVESITLSQTSMVINVNESVQLAATISPSGAGLILSWTSSDESVATVDSNGLVTAVANGICTVICAATDGTGIYASCEVAVGDTWMIDGHAYVPLGLGSGTLWATCNVGASSPEMYGDYYAWGETETKLYYSSSNYFDSSYTKYNKNGQIEFLPEDDAAYVNWGTNWRVPSSRQWEELRDVCTWVWTSLNGINGYRVTGPNGNSIFLPAAGFIEGTELQGPVGTQGDYWSRTIYTPYGSGSGIYMHLLPSSYNTSQSSRYNANSIRPVRNL